MEKPFKKLKGNRIYLLYPKEVSSALQLSAETKKSLADEQMKKLNRFKVYAVGDGVTDPDITEGCEVMIDITALMQRQPPIIEITPGVEIICMSVYDVAHVW